MHRAKLSIVKRLTLLWLLLFLVPCTAQAATYTVINTNNSGAGSLRQAILDANGNAGLDTIDFNIPTTDPGYTASPLSYTIQPTSVLPDITDPVVIDGTTQPDFPGTPIIELDGSAIVSTVNGIRITAGSSTVRGLVVNRFTNNGIKLDGSGNNVIERNYIGTDVTGTASRPNDDDGIDIENSSNNTIGGTTAAARNIISGNTSAGINIWDTGSTGNIIQGNYIGTDINGNGNLGNGEDGLHIRTDTSNSTVGGTGLGEGNIIAFNGFAGIVVTDLNTDNNLISGNAIFSNGGLGIDLGNDGVGGGNGANNDKAAPTIGSITPAGADFTVVATVTSGDTIEFFRANNAAAPGVSPDGSGFGEGYLFLGSCVDNGACSGPHISAGADADPTAGTVQATLLSSGLSGGDTVSATATDSSNNTSEFAANVVAPVSSSGDVYYSVGTNTADLKNGAPTISITSGTATLSVAQTGNIGVGDEIDYDTGNSIAYIKSIVSPTQFVVHTATGGIPGNVTPVTVNAIRRAFNTIASAEANSGDASHLTTFDLTATGADANLTWVSYNDGDFTGGATIDGYTTNATRFITLTVAGASQVASGTSQRHNGTAGTGVVLDGQDAALDGIIIQDDYTVLEWFELKRHAGADQVNSVNVAAANVMLTHLLIYDFEDATPTNTTNGIEITGAGGNSFTARNCIIYGNATVPGKQNGIHGNTATDTATIENCTIYGMNDDGIDETSSTFTVRNTIAMGNLVQDFDVINGTQSYNISSDATATGTGSLINRVTANQFVSITPGSENLHLKAGADAINTGTDLSVSFTDDIDGDTRPIAGLWEIGVP